MSPGELLTRERAQGRNLYRFRTKLDFIPSLSFFHKGKLTVRLSSRIYSHKCHRKRFYSINRKLSGVIDGFHVTSNDDVCFDFFYI